VIISNKSVNNQTIQLPHHFKLVCDTLVSQEMVDKYVKLKILSINDFIINKNMLEVDSYIIDVSSEQVLCSVIQEKSCIFCIGKNMFDAYYEQNIFLLYSIVPYINEEIML
jgi:hypothetical protein